MRLGTKRAMSGHVATCPRSTSLTTSPTLPPATCWVAPGRPLTLSQDLV